MVLYTNLVLSNLHWLVRLILHIESHMVYRVLLFHAVIKRHNLHKKLIKLMKLPRIASECLTLFSPPLHKDANTKKSPNHRHLIITRDICTNGCLPGMDIIYYYMKG